MLRLALSGLILLAVSIPTRANTVACGGNSYSYAEIVESHRAHRRAAPLEVVPDSLCADLIEDRRHEIESLEFTIEPGAPPDTEGGVPGRTPRGGAPSGP
jgi:hypothetical protein